LTPRPIFLFGGVLTLVGAIFVLVLSPESLVRAAVGKLLTADYTDERG
jgi:hypothetical protein